MVDIELVGTFLIAGIFILSILTMNFELLETSATNTMQTNTQENITEIASILEYDLRKAGYGVPTGTTAILAASDSTIRFLTDIDRNGSIDTINYRLSTTADASSTDNPNDRFLYRNLNGTENDVGAGLTDLSFTYYDTTMTATTTLADIRVVEMTFTVQSLFGFNDEYAEATWVSHLMPKNLEEF